MYGSKAFESWLRPTDEIQYFGIYLNKYLSGHYQSKLVMQKLARALGMFLKVRHYVTKAELKNIYSETSLDRHPIRRTPL